QSIGHRAKLKQLQARAYRGQSPRSEFPPGFCRLGNNELRAVPLVPRVAPQSRELFWQRVLAFAGAHPQAPSIQTPCLLRPQSTEVETTNPMSSGSVAPDPSPGIASLQSRAPLEPWAAISKAARDRQT